MSSGDRKYRLVNVEKRGKVFHETFEVPPLEERESLRSGDFAKLIFVDSLHNVEERMWVKVFKRLEDGWIEGVLDNEPLYLMFIKLGDIVKFKPRNICNTERGK